jgi:hypothetical protein
MIPMFAIVLLAASIVGALALIHAYRHETEYARRIGRDAR